MPIIIPKDLPAYDILDKEKIFVMSKDRAVSQDIRALRLLIVNLMPTKEKTETQLLRKIANSALQVDVDFLRTSTHESSHTSKNHMNKFYLTLDEVKNKKYDAMIVTGAPVEKLDFEEVDYWNELKEIMDFSKTNVFSTMYICWASQAALYYYYGIEKKSLDEKLFGVYNCEVISDHTIVSGFDDFYFVPHSRYTYSDLESIEKNDDLIVISKSDEVGMNIAISKDERSIFISGHGEYDIDTLEKEYLRDISQGLDTKIPKNYYRNDDPKDKILVRWKSYSSLLFSNWLNHCVYQRTPFDIEKIGKY